jgi:hypothetical protein
VFRCARFENRVDLLARPLYVRLGGHGGGIMEGSPRKLIGEFLLELEADEALRRRFTDNAAAVLANESGLDEEQQRIVREGSLAEIRDAIRDEYGTARVMLFPVWHFFTAEEGSDYEGPEESE